MRRSTSHGRTWSEFRVIDGNSSTRRGTPSAVPLDSGEVFLTYVKWPFDPARFGVGLRKSTSDGVDWSAETDLAAELRSSSVGQISPSPDSGLQLRSDPARLVIPFHNAVVLSTDRGASWRATHLFVPSEVGESAVADLGGGELLLNARSMNHEVKQGRAVSIAQNYGKAK